MRKIYKSDFVKDFVKYDSMMVAMDLEEEEVRKEIKGFNYHKENYSYKGRKTFNGVELSRYDDKKMYIDLNDKIIGNNKVEVNVYQDGDFYLVEYNNIFNYKVNKNVYVKRVLYKLNKNAITI